MTASERIVGKIVDDCREGSIYPRWPAVGERLLSRTSELRGVFAEIDRQIGSNWAATYQFWDAIFCSADAWRPDALCEMRANTRRLKEVNSEIAFAARHLAKLLRERDALHNGGSVHFTTHYCMLDVMADAVPNHHRFHTFVSKKLASIQQQFDTKYWPTLVECIQEIGRDASNCELIEECEISSVALQSNRPSKADFLRAMFARVSNCLASVGGALPETFRLRDKDWADLVNVLLDLGPDDIVSTDYVKNLRYRDSRRDVG